MTVKQLLLPVLFLACALTCRSESPFACNLKAFQPQERLQWRKLLDQVTAAVLVTRELSDGYALQVDTRRASIVEVAEWVSLERKCCPFFDFRVELQGETETLWLSLTGREGVKQFIEMDFTSLKDKLTKH